MPRYNPAVIEPKWQQFWEENRTFSAPKLPKGRKLYVLDMFPYPSGDGLHVGHPEGYTATDIVCRFNRMKGTSVMHPMGWDAFGLPAEQHAKKTGTHPRETTEKNIDNFRRQLKMLGFSYDWDRELATTDLGYFRWTQFIFLVLFDTWFDEAQHRGRPIADLPIPADVADEGEDAVARYRDEHRLAYQLEAPVNWCPALGTVLANEEVVGGLSERGGHPVVRIPLRQWMLRITAYADRLENDLDTLDWSEGIKMLQRNWIGRSTGAEVDFFIGIITDEEGKPSPKEYMGWLVDRKIAGWLKKPDEEVLRIYTTRADTLFGATYMVISPEHPYVERLTKPEQAQAVREYCEQSSRKSDMDRTDLAKEKTGVFTGSYAINPVNGEAIPIWIADYVLISYGTGAIMAVPAHDTRDFEFAQKFNLPIIAVVDPGNISPLPMGEGQGVRASDASNPHPNPLPKGEGTKLRDDLLAGRVAFIADGTAINSGPYNGLSTPEFKTKIAEDLAEKGIGRNAVNYKLRDWLFSRQHFWGEPFPILHELDSAGKPNGRIRPLKPEDLPLDLPAKMSFDSKHDEPTPPLDKAPHDWLYVTIGGKRYKRETNTMPQWAGSCWYYLRFLDPKNNKTLVDPKLERAWMPVDLYVGGAEHAVLHLLYARFWHKVLFDRGYVSMPEPFQKLVNQGMILGEMEFTGYQTGSGQWVSATDVTDDAEGNPRNKIFGDPVKMVKVAAEAIEKQGETFVLKSDAEIRIDSRAYKMSKSRGNVVNPDQVVAEYGADALRLYEMFMGPLEAVKPWSMDGVSGVRNFLDRAWRLIIDDRAETMQLNPAVQDAPPTAEQNRMLHKTIKVVTNDIEQMSFNTAIARMMEFTNFFFKEDLRPREAMQKFVLLLSPFAPHLAEELWQALGNAETLAYEPWPAYDKAMLRQDTIEVPVQVNGKLRGRIQAPTGADNAALESLARADAKVAEHLSGKKIIKVIVIPGKMVNFVVK
ncbi:MAG: class I tRNA ligase family protein [Thermoguttaceae bacterium]|jgi:leucyl-tRNA synthetase